MGPGCLLLPARPGRVLLLGGADTDGAFADAHVLELGERRGQGCGALRGLSRGPRGADAAGGARRVPALGPGRLERAAAALRARHLPAPPPPPAPLGLRRRRPGREQELRPGAGPR